MQNRRAMPLMARLSLTLLAVTVVAMTLLALGLYLVVRQYEQQRRTTELNAQADLYASLAQELIVASGDLQAVTPILVNRSVGEGSLTIRVFGSAGQVFGASGRAAPFPSRAVSSLLPASVLSMLVAEDADRRYVARKIVWRQRLVGVVELSQSVADEQRLLALLRRALGQTTIIAALAAVTGSFLVARWLARLIDQLRQATAAIAAGDLEVRAVEHGPHEVVELTRSVNSMAAQLAERLQRLQEQGEAQRRFYRDVSHELRTPLMALGGYLENVEDARDDHERDSSIVAMQAEIARLARLADELLRADTSPQLTLGPLRTEDLGALLGSWLVNVRSRAERAGVDLRWEPPPAPVLAAVDADRLKQAVLNLLDNGLRATPPGGSIGIQLAAAAGLARIEIVDTGAGIPETLREAVWERGVRGADGGSGLGLAIVRSIMRAHGGEARLLPTPNGAHMLLTLPCS